MTDFLKKSREREDLAKEFGFKTIDDFKANFVYHKGPVLRKDQRGDYCMRLYKNNFYPFLRDMYPFVSDYIELKKPIHGITMIHKENSEFLWTYQWNKALYHAENLTVGGFEDWCIPLKEELETLSRIKTFCGLGGSNAYFWSSSTTNDADYAFEVSFCTCQTKKIHQNSYRHLICVRVTPEEYRLHQEMKAKLKDLQMNEKLALECGFDILEEFRTNFIDRGDYIELKKPICGISMIQKYPSENEMEWEESQKYAEQLRIGGFCGWRVPSIEELEILYKIKDVCGIKEKLVGSWASPLLSKEAYFMSFYWGRLYNRNINSLCKTISVRCVR